MKRCGMEVRVAVLDEPQSKNNRFGCHIYSGMEVDPMDKSKGYTVKYFYPCAVLDEDGKYELVQTIVDQVQVFSRSRCS